MTSKHKTKETPRFSAGERALLVALIQRREATVIALAGAAHLSPDTTRRALRRFESLGAAVCFSRVSIDGRSVRALWSASAAVLDLLAESGIPHMARALVAPSARDKVLTALGLRPGMTIGEIAWATGLSRATVTEMLAVLEKQDGACRVERRGPSGGRQADGWMLTLDNAAEPLFEL